VCVFVKQSEKLYVTTDEFLDQKLATAPHSGLRHQSSNATIRTSANDAVFRFAFETRHAGWTNVQGAYTTLTDFFEKQIFSSVTCRVIYNFDLRLKSKYFYAESSILCNNAVKKHSASNSITG